MVPPSREIIFTTIMVPWKLSIFKVTVHTGTKFKLDTKGNILPQFFSNNRRRGPFKHTIKVCNRNLLPQAATVKNDHQIGPFSYSVKIWNINMHLFSKNYGLSATVDNSRGTTTVVKIMSRPDPWGWMANHRGQRTKNSSKQLFLNLHFAKSRNMN